MTEKISKEEILEELHRVANDVDGPLTRPEFNDRADISAWTAEDRFGGWNNAKQAAGLPTLNRGRKKKNAGLLPRSRQRDKIEQIKANVPCYLCSEKYPPCVMDFHHRDPEEKYKTIGALTTSYAWDTVKEELDKCILLCANCHRLVEYDEVSI